MVAVYQSLNRIFQSVYNFTLILGAILIVFISQWNLAFVYPVLIVLFTLQFILKISSRKSIHIHTADLLFVFFLIYEYINLFYSKFPYNTEQLMLKTISFFLLYYIWSMYLQKRNLKQILYIVIYVYSFFILLLGTIYYVSFFSELYELGLNTDVSPFKFRLMPLSIQINDWVSILLSILPFTLLLVCSGDRTKKVIGYVFFTLLNIQLLLSFSKGALLATIFFYGLFFVFLFFKKEYQLLTKIGIVLTLTTAIVVFSFSDSYKAMFSYSNKHLSQKRSIDGRLNIWTNSINIFKENPVLGVGGDNFNFSFVKSEEIKDFPYRPYNIGLKLLIEKGILGLIVYTALFVWFIVCSILKVKERWKEKLSVQNLSYVLFFVAFMALILRDQTFNSLFFNNILLINCSLFYANNVSK